MITLRSFLFNALFYLVLLVYLVVAIPTLLMPRRAIMRLAQQWGRVNLALLRLVCGIRVEWRGLDKIPPGAVLVAAKHQSLWETFALLTLLDDPAYILKRELLWLPFYGWYARHAGMIPVDRGGGKAALIAMAARVRAALNEGRQVIVFPEGTRRAPGAEPKYKYGIAHLYGEGVAPCVPIALNSGLFWPRRRFLRYPGTITVEVLDPIAPGLPIDAFFARLEREIEAATARLIAQGGGVKAGLRLAGAAGTFIRRFSQKESQNCATRRAFKQFPPMPRYQFVNQWSVPSRREKGIGHSCRSQSPPPSTTTTWNGSISTR